MVRLKMEEIKGMIPDTTRFIVEVLGIGKGTLEDLKEKAEKLREALAAKGEEMSFTVFPLELEETCSFYKFSVDCWSFKRFMVGKVIIDIAERQSMDVGKLKRRFK